MQGRRDYMEDTNAVHHLKGISLYAVFDGHAGEVTLIDVKMLLNSPDILSSRRPLFLYSF